MDHLNSPDKAFSPLKILAIIASSIFLAQALVTLFLFFIFPALPLFVEALVDSALLLILISPALFLFLFRPIEKVFKEREKVLTKVEESNKFLKTVIDSLPHPFYVVDTKTYKILMANSAAGLDHTRDYPACHLYTHKETSPCSGENDPCPMEIVRKTKKPVTVEHIHYYEDGKTGIFEVHGYPILNENEELIQMIEYCTDITKRKLAEDALNQSYAELERRVVDRTKDLLTAKENAERSDRAKTTFLANMSHEVRTPLNGVLNFSLIGMEQAEQNEQTELKNYFQEIHDCGNRLLQFVDNLLELSRHDSITMVFNFQRLELLHIIYFAYQQTMSLFSKQKIECEIIEPDFSTMCMLDEEKMQKALVNLLTNAVHYSPEGSRVEISLQRYESNIRMMISDEGVGIPEDELDKIFERFTQSSRTEDGSGGTGLGLAVCRDIIEGHSGRIWAENRGTKGTNFILSLPLASEE
ncbi:ATP-binding protein [Candidatus Riflebacteria bacterium]